MAQTKARWFTVETECNRERKTHWVFAKSGRAAASEAREREFQAWSGYHVVTVVSTYAA